MLQTVLMLWLQKLLLPNKQGDPKARWLQEVRRFGQLRRFVVERDDGYLSCIEICNSKTSRAKVAILAHPVSRKGKFYFNEGRRISLYLAQGYDLWLFDFNGFGESDRIDLFYWKDVQAVLQALISQRQPSHVVLHGLSFGSYHMIRAIQALPNQATVVMENTARSFYDYWRRWFLSRNLARLLQLLQPQWYRDMDVMAALKELQRSDLKFACIACENDIFTPADEMEDLLTHLKSPKEFTLFKDAGHMEAPLVNAKLYAETITQAIT